MKHISNGGARVPRPSEVNDRRKEPRFDTSGAAKLSILDSANPELSAVIINVSRSGFQVELAAPLEPGLRVELRVGKVKLFGDIVSCRRCGVNRHRVSATITLYAEASRPPKVAVGD